MSPEKIKELSLIRLVDDEAEITDALTFFLQIEGWKTVAYHSAKEFLANDLPSQPGCLVLDVRMPGLTGIQCQRLLKEHGCNLPIVFLTGHGDIDMAVQAVLDGAIDFLQKPVDEERLLRGIMKGCTLSVSQSLGIASPEEAAARVSQLTTREYEIARLIAEGLVSRQIGERLGIAVRTVEVHRASALKKLGTHDPQEVRALLAATHSTQKPL